MSFETYDVYFSGKLLKGQDRDEVQKKIGAIFKLEGPRLQHLFSGKPVAIKKNLDMDQASKYRVVFREAGALVDIRPTGSEQPPASPPPAEKEANSASLSLSSVNGYDLSDCTAPVEPQEIPDIDYLSLEKPGVILDDTPSVEPLEIDTSELVLDMPGATLAPASSPPTARIDTSNLQLDPPNQGSLEAYQQQVEPVPLPNIDHLEFTEQGEQSDGKASLNLDSSVDRSK
jgi:hypothetical protein